MEWNSGEMDAKRWAIVALVLGSVTDIATTIYGLEMVASISELNPVAAGFMDSYGYAGLLTPTILMFIVALDGAWIIERYNREPYGYYGAVAAVGVIASMKLLISGWNTFLILTV